MNFVSLTVGFIPVLAFLVGLRLMDSYRLVHVRTLSVALGGGVTAALLAFALHLTLMDQAHVTPQLLRSWVAPVSEECLKALLVAWLIGSDRVGFVVDAAVLGFAIGTGFALAENTYYASVLGDPSLSLWLARGLGTAIMHGSTTALFAIIGKALHDRWPNAAGAAFLPGFVVAVAIHATFNQLSTSPFISTGMLLMAMPLLLLAAFDLSERTTREWLSSGFDNELEMLESVLGGRLEQSPIGRYLDNLRSRFEPMIVADLFCLLTIHLELSLRAKGMLMARAAGIEVPVDQSVRANLKELKFLEQAVGVTGRLAIMPLRRQSQRDLWQILVLEEADDGSEK